VSLSRAQVRVLVESGLFDDALRQALAVIGPLARTVYWRSQRHRTRTLYRARHR
jgi:hypothetical protein